MSEYSPKTIYLRFYLAYCFCAVVVYVLLMAFVLPWWHASNHPVVVHLAAGSAQNIGIAYSPDEEPLRLVPVGDVRGYHLKWATELPPRPEYALQMVFPEGTFGEVVFKQLELIQLEPVRRSTFLKIRDVPLMERPGIQLKKLVDGIRIQAEPGAVLDLEVEVAEPTAYTWIKTWSRASFGFLLFALVLFFALVSLLQFPDRVQAYRERTPPLEFLLTLLFAMLGAAMHMYLLNYAMPVFTPGESDQHVELAIRLHDGLELADTPAANLPKRPGYATFVSIVAGQADWDMHAVVRAQGLLFCTALALLGLAVNRLIHAWIIGPVLVVACLSPAVVWVNRHIGAESLSLTAVLLSLCAFLYVWQTERIGKWLAFLLFAVVLTVAITITSTASLLLILPAGMLTGSIFWAITIRRLAFWRLQVLWRTAAQVAMCIAIVLVGLSIVEKAYPGSWNLLDLPVSHSHTWATAHMLEPHALDDADELLAVVNGRLDQDYAVDWRNFVSSASAHQASRLLPLRAKLAVMGKLAYMGFFLPDVEIAPGNELRRNFTIHNAYTSKAEASGVQDSLTEIMLKTGRAVFVPERRSNKQVVSYNQTAVGFYRWFYSILFVLGLAGWFTGLVDRKYLAGLFVLPFMLNVLLSVFSINLASELIQSMDSLLLLGALAGLLGLNAKSLQKPKDESDRRSLKPIRPKRLLTRQKKTLYVHHGN